MHYLIYECPVSASASVRIISKSSCDRCTRALLSGCDPYFKIRSKNVGTHGTEKKDTRDTVESSTVSASAAATGTLRQNG